MVEVILSVEGGREKVVGRVEDGREVETEVEKVGSQERSRNLTEAFLRSGEREDSTHIRVTMIPLTLIQTDLMVR